MKLIVAGSTGFVAGEIIRQALANPAITSIVALGRRPAPEPANTGPTADVTKLKSVILQDLGNEYPESVKKELSGADACIWTIAITPSKSATMPWEQTVKVCRDYAIKGIETLSQLPRGSQGKTPLRFVYISGSNSERDPSKKPMILGDYCLMRGEAESRILELAKQSNGAVEACVAKPGLISGPEKPAAILQRAFLSLIGVPGIKVSEVSAALVHQVVNGFEKETLLNEDMVRIAQGVLEGQK
ncbi:Protein FMP52, mitochondrial [Madurella mycetomatis]|uniref:Protein FMP52, mitochondrial n=1 Tax=Madurella mycetomatis TaxID=100816 RepID=A0A175WA77_9PEZI|nr:Protein FMP52, mitochondrial [Madurella mycetomatis]